MDNSRRFYSFFENKLNDGNIYELYFPEEFKISGKRV